MKLQFFFGFTTLHFILLTNDLIGTEGLETNESFSRPFPPKMPEETCQRKETDTTVIGLKPYITNGGLGDDCKHFWYCRVNGLFDPPTPNETVTSAMQPSIIKVPVEAVKFACDADPAKPFFNSETCQCVETSNHCENNFDHLYDCTRPYDTANGEPLESCRGFGPSEVYYQDQFAHFDDPTKFWSCSPFTDHSTWVHKGIPSNCSYNADPEIIWDSTKCSTQVQCFYRESEEQGNLIHHASIHPMNRFNCAKRYYAPATCADQDGQYYIGDIPNFNDCSTFYSCIKNDDPYTLAIPMLTPCAEGHQFNVLSCKCEVTGSFSCEVNVDPKNTFRCAFPQVPV